jgi:electron-transferring-flavoprotein dehydrogenase
VVSLGNVCRWLAGKAEGKVSEIYPGFATAEVLFDGNGAVAASPPVTWASPGRPPRIRHRGGRARNTLFARARAAISARRCWRALALPTAASRKIRLRLRAVAGHARHRRRVQHTFGWPLDNSTGGGSFLYHFDDRLVAVGFVLHLNYRNPYLAPFEEFQRFKTHPLVRGTFEGGKRLAYGARALTEGGWQSVPKLASGGALVGCAAAS